MNLWMPVFVYGNHNCTLLRDLGVKNLKVIQIRTFNDAAKDGEGGGEVPPLLSGKICILEKLPKIGLGPTSTPGNKYTL